MLNGHYFPVIRSSANDISLPVFDEAFMPRSMKLIVNGMTTPGAKKNEGCKAMLRNLTVKLHRDGSVFVVSYSMKKSVGPRSV